MNIQCFLFSSPSLYLERSQRNIVGRTSRKNANRHGVHNRSPHRQYVMMVALNHKWLEAQEVSTMWSFWLNGWLEPKPAVNVSVSTTIILSVPHPVIGRKGLSLYSLANPVHNAVDLHVYCTPRDLQIQIIAFCNPLCSRPRLFCVRLGIGYLSCYIWWYFSKIRLLIWYWWNYILMALWF